jgi:hypothetical protein
MIPVGGALVQAALITITIKTAVNMRNFTVFLLICLLPKHTPDWNILG